MITLCNIAAGMNWPQKSISVFFVAREILPAHWQKSLKGAWLR